MVRYYHFEGKTNERKYEMKLISKNISVLIKI